MKFECKQHKRTFQNGTGFSAHMRSRAHVVGSLPVRVDKPEADHLRAALEITDAEIGKLKARREYIAKAIAS